MAKFHYEFAQAARNAGKSWLQEQMLAAENITPLTTMISTVERFILLSKGIRVKIQLRAFSRPDGVGIHDIDLQLLGRAYDVAKANGF